MVAAPVALVGEAEGGGTERGLVVKLDARHGVGVEVVIDMQSVNVVALHDVCYDGAYVVAVFLQGGVEDEHPVVVDEALGVFLVGVLDAQALGALGLGTVGVDPCV